MKWKKDGLSSARVICVTKATTSFEIIKRIYNTKQNSIYKSNQFCFHMTR